MQVIIKPSLLIPAAVSRSQPPPTGNVHCRQVIDGQTAQGLNCRARRIASEIDCVRV